MSTGAPRPSSLSGLIHEAIGDDAVLARMASRSRMIAEYVLGETVSDRPTDERGMLRLVQRLDPTSLEAARQQIRTKNFDETFCADRENPARVFFDLLTLQQPDARKPLDRLKGRNEFLCVMRLAEFFEVPDLLNYIPVYMFLSENAGFSIGTRLDFLFSVQFVNLFRGAIGPDTLERIWGSLASSYADLFVEPFRNTLASALERIVACWRNDRDVSWGIKCLFRIRNGLQDIAATPRGGTRIVSEQFESEERRLRHDFRQQFLIPIVAALWKLYRTLFLPDSDAEGLLSRIIEAHIQLQQCAA